MGRKRRNFKRGGARFVQLEHWLLDSAAWKSLPPGSRALYVELKRLYNGANNGDLFLSQRRASELLNCDKDTAGRYFVDLQERGFIHKTQEPHLGPVGVGIATKWRLTEATVNGEPATKDFMAWAPEIQKPVRKMGTPCPHHGDTSPRRTAQMRAGVPTMGTVSAGFAK